MGVYLNNFTHELCQRVRTLLRSKDALASVLLIAWHLIYFFPITLGQRVWFTWDIARLYHPFGVELSRALSEGRLPLWTPNVLAGFPLFAEGHVATFYPIYLVLFRLLAPHYAISYAMLLHLVWGAIGMYTCARSIGSSRASAFLAAFVFSFNGMMLEKLYHTPIIVASAWLPWLIFFQDRFQRTRAAIWFFFAALTIGVQLVAGFPQTALLSAIAFGLFGFFGSLFWNRDDGGIARQVLLSTILPLVLGVSIAAIQVVPTSELIQYSVRSSDLQNEFLTEYSLPPAFLSQFVLPYTQGEPIEHTNEYWAYFGLAPFALAILAPFLRRDRRTIFLALFALGALSLALGNANPAYHLIYRLPVFSFFRTPARYIFLFIFAAILLSATAFDDLSKRLTSPRTLNKTTVAIGVGFGLLTLGAFGLAQIEPLKFWLDAWRWLPLALWLGALFVIVLAWKRRLTQTTFNVALIGLTIFDLASFAPPFLATLAQMTPASYVETPPRSIAALGPARVTDRLFTDVNTVPSVPALRASLYPNMATVYDRQHVQAYSPLIYSRHDSYLAHLSPTMLGLLNVRFFLMPLEPRFSDRVAAPYPSLALDAINNETNIPPTIASSIEITSFTEQTAQLAPGTQVAQVIVTFDDASVQTFPLRIGIETDDWDFDRAQTLGLVQHSRARVARTYAGVTRAFGKPFDAHTYLARDDFAPARRVVAVNIRSELPNGRLCVERVSLIGADGQTVSLATLTGKANFAVAFMSDTVAAWENLDVMPRAFVVHSAEVMPDDAALARLEAQSVDVRRIVLLSEGQAIDEPANAADAQDEVAIEEYKPERVQVSVVNARAGYLVLTDSWYPGWDAFVDGKSAPILRADVLFRAVPLEPGSHTVRFEYRPRSLVWGALISAASLALTGFIAFILNNRGLLQQLYNP